MGHQKTQPEPEQEDLVSLRDLLAQKDDQIAHLTHHLSAHTSHTSHLQHRLLTTLHTLDLLSFSHASQIAELEGEKKVLVEKGKRVADKLDRFVEWAGSVEADRDELREAVGMLIRKVELSNDDFSTWPYSNMHITKLLEPIVFDRHYSKTKHKHKARTKSNPTPHSYSRSRSPNDESFCTCPSPLPIQHTQSCDQRQYDQHHHITPRDRTDHPSNDQADLISYATSLIRTLTHERDSERKEHERTKREAGKRVRELEAVVGRLEGEVEALLCGVLGRGGATGNGGASEEVRGVREKERRKEERKKKRKSEENGGLPTQTQPSPRIPFESTPIQVGLMTQPNPISPTRLMTQEEAIAALEMAVVRNRGLEVEVKALGVRLERARAMKQLQEQGEEDERGGSSPEMGQESSRPNTPTLHNPLPQTKFEGYVNHSRKGSEDIVVPVTGGGDGPRPLERAFGPSPVPTQAHTSTSQVHTSTSQAHTSSTEAHTSASTQVHTSTSAQAHVSIPPPGHTPSSPLSRSPPPQRLSEDIVAGMEPPSPLPPELELTIHSLPSNDELSLQGGVEHEPRPLENPPRVSVHAEPEVQGESGVSVETLLPPLPHESQSRALQHLDEQIVLLREEVEKLKVERGLLAEMVGRAGLVRTSREWEAGQELSEEEFRGVLVLEEECIRLRHEVSRLQAELEESKKEHEEREREVLGEVERLRACLGLGRETSEKGDLQHLDEVQPPPVAKVRHEREEEDDGEEPMDLATPLPPTSLLPGFTPSPARRNYDESEDEETKSTPMESPTLNPRLIPLPTSRSPSPFSPSLSSAVSDMSVVSTPLPSTSRTRGIGIGMPNFYRPHLGALTDEASSSSPWIPRSSDLMMENTSSFVGQSSAIGALGGLGSPFRDRSGSTATHPSPFVYSLRSYQQPVDSPLSLRPTSSTSTPLHLPPSISTPVYHPAPVPTPRSISTPPHNPTPPHQRPLSTPFHPPPSSVARNVERIEGELEIARRELEEKEGLIGEMKEGVERLRRWLVGVEERRRGERDLIDL